MRPPLRDFPWDSSLAFPIVHIFPLCLSGVHPFQFPEELDNIFAKQSWRGDICFDESTRRKIKLNAFEQWRQDRPGRRSKDKASTPAQPMTACWWEYFFLIICQGVRVRQYRGALNNSEWFNLCCVDLLVKSFDIDNQLHIALHIKEKVHFVKSCLWAARKSTKPSAWCCIGL